MNTELDNAINYLQRLKQKIEDKTASTGFIHADLEDKFKEGLFKPLFELASRKQPAASSKNLRLCKVEGNTDSFYFHKWLDLDYLPYNHIKSEPAPQHHNILLVHSVFALVEDKKGKLFVTSISNIKFID